jgi:hypothetical protein
LQSLLARSADLHDSIEALMAAASVEVRTTHELLSVQHALDLIVRDTAHTIGNDSRFLLSDSEFSRQLYLRQHRVFIASLAALERSTAS